MHQIKRLKKLVLDMFSYIKALDDKCLFLIQVFFFSWRGCLTKTEKLILRFISPIVAAE